MSSSHRVMASACGTSTEAPDEDRSALRGAATAAGFRDRQLDVEAAGSWAATIAGALARAQAGAPEAPCILPSMRLQPNPPRLVTVGIALAIGAIGLVYAWPIDARPDPRPGDGYPRPRSG